MWECGEKKWYIKQILIKKKPTVCHLKEVVQTEKRNKNMTKLVFYFLS